MRTIIAGSRTITDYEQVKLAVMESKFNVTRVVSGGARGIDRLGERWAKECGLPISVYPAQWNTYGKAAGFIRNNFMAEHADALIAIWDGTSKGTKNMIEQATKKGLKIYVVTVIIQ